MLAGSPESFVDLVYAGSTYRSDLVYPRQRFWFLQGKAFQRFLVDRKELPFSVGDLVWINLLQLIDFELAQACNAFLSKNMATLSLKHSHM